MKDLLVFLADGFEEIEALTVVDYLRRGDIEVTTVSIKDTNEVEGAHKIKVLADEVLDDVNIDDFRALYIPGGLPGATNLRDDERVIEAVKKFKEEDKLTAAICAGPMVFDKAEILNENSFTTYPGVEEKLNTKGRQDSIVYVDGNVITGMGPALAMNMAFELIKQLKDESTMEDVKQDVLFYDLKKGIC